MIKVLAMALLSLLAIISVGCYAINAPTSKAPVVTVTCNNPEFRVPVGEAPPVALEPGEVAFHIITYGLRSATGDGTELRTESSDCYLVMRPPPGEHHLFVRTVTTDGVESHPIESKPFTIKARPATPTSVSAEVN